MIFRASLAAVVGFAIGGCDTVPYVHEGKVTGTVTYLQRIALPPQAQVRVQLVDVSRADDPAEVVSEVLFVPEGKQVPFRFEIPYDAGNIDSRTTYAVSARITVDGQLRFINDKRYAVITNGAPSHVDMVLVPAGGPR